MKRLTMLLTGILLVGTLAMGESSTGRTKEYKNYRGEKVEFTVDTHTMVGARISDDREDMVEDGYVLVEHQVGDSHISTVWYDVEDEEYIVMEVAQLNEDYSTYIYAEGDTLDEVVEYVNKKTSKFTQYLEKEQGKNI